MIFKLPGFRRRGIDEEELSAYVDGSLDAAARARVEQELERSADSRMRLAALQSTVGALRTAASLRAPRSFALTPSMAYGPTRPIRRSQIAPLTPAMAAAAAALAVGLLLIGNLTGALRQSGGVAEDSAAMRVTGPAGPAGPASLAMGAGVEAATPAPAPLATATSAPTAPAGPQSVAVPASTEVATPPAAEQTVVDTVDAKAEEALATPGEFLASKGAVELTAAPPGAPQPPLPGQTSESGVPLPLWQIEATLGALAAALAGLALILALQRRRTAPRR